MFVIVLKFSDNKSAAGQWMDGHNAWLKQGFDDGVFLLAGSLQPQQGGAIIANGTTRQDLDDRVASDPFVEQGVVSAEILEISPAKAAEPLQFLLS